jgi:hypothetical protein
MTVFDVSVNGRKLCRAGVGADGVLNAIISWVKLTGPALQEARRRRHPAEELRLHVGGLAGDTHRRWPERSLQVGDRVAVDVTSAKTFDAPSRVVSRDSRRDERAERRYYMRLKRKFEGPERAVPRLGPRADDDATTRFLNVDLDIWSRSPLEPLVRGFGEKVFALHIGKEGRGRHGAHLELAASGGQEQADKLIRDLVALVKKLPRSSRTLWNLAQAREFNLGIQAGSTPFSYELRLEPRTLRAVASVNARLTVTVYRP